MTEWSDQLEELGFNKYKKEDGSVTFKYFSDDRRHVFWTQITVKQVGKPSPDAWQVTYTRSEIQIGFWKAHDITKSIEVRVHNSASKLIEEINQQMSIKPNLLTKISN